MLVEKSETDKQREREKTDMKKYPISDLLIVINVVYLVN
jgi:hypothetical protein